MFLSDTSTYFLWIVCFTWNLSFLVVDCGAADRSPGIHPGPAHRRTSGPGSGREKNAQTRRYPELSFHHISRSVHSQDTRLPLCDPVTLGYSAVLGRPHQHTAALGLLIPQILGVCHGPLGRRPRPSPAIQNSEHSYGTLPPERRACVDIVGAK
jgi:hypothetical protein